MQKRNHSNSIIPAEVKVRNTLAHIYNSVINSQHWLKKNETHLTEKMYETIFLRVLFVLLVVFKWELA